MKKNIRRALSVLLALIMVLSIGVVASAEPATPTVEDRAWYYTSHFLLLFEEECDDFTSFIEALELLVYVGDPILDAAKNFPPLIEQFYGVEILAKYTVLANAFLAIDYAQIAYEEQRFRVWNPATPIFPEYCYPIPTFYRLNSAGTYDGSYWSEDLIYYDRVNDKWIYNNEDGRYSERKWKTFSDKRDAYLIFVKNLEFHYVSEPPTVPAEADLTYDLFLEFYNAYIEYYDNGAAYYSTLMQSIKEEHDYLEAARRVLVRNILWDRILDFFYNFSNWFRNIFSFG